MTAPRPPKDIADGIYACNCKPESYHCCHDISTDSGGARYFVSVMFAIPPHDHGPLPQIPQRS